MRDVALCSAQMRINPLYLDRHIKTKLFEIMDHIGNTQLNSQSYHITYDEKGTQLPLLMCGWLQGFVNCNVAKTLIEAEINHHPEWFKCAAEKRLILNTARLIFTPELLARSRKLSPAGMAFVKKCKRNGHQIYGLSNWDKDSFEHLKHRYPEFFALFDGIIISGNVHANKPHPTIYHALLNQYQLNPQDCWFIDDQIENIQAARKIGINAVQFTSTFQKLSQDIRLAILNRSNGATFSTAPATRVT